MVLVHPERTVDPEPLRRLLDQAARDHDVTITYLGLVLTDRETVHDLNRRFLGHDYPTDVIAFCLDDDALEKGRIDGEIYVDLDMAAERAPEFGSDFRTEVARYALHGLLHLLGYDDATEQGRDRMRAREEAYLRGMP